MKGTVGKNEADDPDLFNFKGVCGVSWTVHRKNVQPIEGTSDEPAFVQACTPEKEAKRKLAMSTKAVEPAAKRVKKAKPQSSSSSSKSSSSSSTSSPEASPEKKKEAEVKKEVQVKVESGLFLDDSTPESIVYSEIGCNYGVYPPASQEVYVSLERCTSFQPLQTAIQGRRKRIAKNAEKGTAPPEVAWDECSFMHDFMKDGADGQRRVLAYEQINRKEKLYNMADASGEFIIPKVAIDGCIGEYFSGRIYEQSEKKIIVSITL